MYPIGICYSWCQVTCSSQSAEIYVTVGSCYVSSRSSGMYCIGIPYVFQSEYWGGTCNSVVLLLCVPVRVLGCM